MLNLNRLKKEEIIYLYNHRCKHHHRFIEIVHPNCLKEFLKNNNMIQERIGFLDIESTGFNADFDYIISYAIYDEQEDKILGRVLTKKEVLNWKVLDNKLMKEFCRDVRKFDRLVVYWGKDRRHDLPFLRSRAIKAKADFPLYKEILVTDLYDICKGKLRLHGYRLEHVCKFLNIPAKQHPLDGDMWLRAKLGDKPGLNYVWEHNKEDVVSMREVYWTMEKYARNPKVSI